MAILDWSQCPAVESVPGKVSGAWVLRGTRMPVSAIFENLEAGANIDDIMEWFEGLDREQVKAVIEFAARSLDKDPAFVPSKGAAPSRVGRVLLGGHFAPEVQVALTSHWNFVSRASSGTIPAMPGIYHITRLMLGSARSSRALVRRSDCRPRRMNPDAALFLLHNQAWLYGFYFSQHALYLRAEILAALVIAA